MINNNEKIKIKGQLMILPSVAIIVIVTLYVIISTLVESLGYIPELSFNNMTFEYYKELFSDTVFLSSLFYSIKVGVVSATVATILGTYLGYYIAKSKSRVIDVLYRLPILLSYIGAATLIYLTYSDKGFLFHILSAAGFSNFNLNLIYNSNGIAVILLNIFKGIPFIAFSIAPVFARSEQKYYFIAQNLGCSKSKYIVKILLPLARRAIFTSFLIILNFNIFTYEGFYYLGPSNPISIGVYAYKTYLSPDLSNRIYGMAINMIMILISLFLCVLYYRMINDKRNEEVVR